MHGGWWAVRTKISVEYFCCVKKMILQIQRFINSWCADFLSVLIVRHLWKNFIFSWWDVKEAAMLEMDCHGWLWVTVKTLSVNLRHLHPWSHVIILLWNSLLIVPDGSAGDYVAPKNNENEDVLTKWCNSPPM